MLKSLSPIIITLFSTAALAYSTPVINGKLVNKTKYPSSAFVISYELECHSPNFGLPGPAPSCGRDSTNVTPDNQGNFVVKELQTSGGLGSEEILHFRIMLNDGSGDFEKESRLFSLSNSDIQKNINQLSVITAFGINSQPLEFNLSSGQSSQAFATGQGRESQIDLEFDFSRGQVSDPIARLTSPLVAHISEYGTKKNNPGLLSERIIYVASDKELPLVADVSRTVGNSFLSQAPLVKDTLKSVSLTNPLPAALLTFSIDDKILPQVNHSVDGVWTGVLVFPGVAPQYEHNLYDAQMTVKCVNGNLVGSVDLESRGGNQRKFKGTLPLTGSCNGEAGIINIKFQYALSVSEQILQIPYQRISPGNLWTSDNSGFSTNKDDFNMNVKIKDQGSLTVGNTGLQRR